MTSTPAAGFPLVPFVTVPDTVPASAEGVDAKNTTQLKRENAAARASRKLKKLRFMNVVPFLSPLGE
jgi:hypothetical protein